MSFKKNLNIFIGILFLLGLISIATSFVFTVDFVEKYIDSDNYLGEQSLLRIEIFQEQTLMIGIGLIVISILCYIFKKQLLRRRELLKGLLTLAITIVAILILGEIFLRIFLADTFYSEYGHGLGDKKLITEYATYNSEGFRDSEHPLKSSKKRIVVLGDSFTFGSGIKNEEDRFTDILDRNLENYEIINLGKPGANTEGELGIYKEYGEKYNPDLIILAYVLNDPEGLGAREDFPFLYQHLIAPYELGGYLYQNSFLYYFIESRIFNILDAFQLRTNYADYLNFLYAEDSVYWENQEKIFSEFNELKKPVLLVIFPLITDFENYPFVEIHNKVKILGEQNNMEVLDLYDIYKEYESKTLIVSNFDSHPNEKAHKIGAEAIKEKIQDTNF